MGGQLRYIVFCVFDLGGVLPGISISHSPPTLYSVIRENEVNSHIVDKFCRGKLHWVLSAMGFHDGTPRRHHQSFSVTLRLRFQFQLQLQLQISLSLFLYSIYTQTHLSSHTMPLVHIHLIRGVRNPTETRKLADIIQEVMLDKFNAPPRDRYQVSSTSYSIHPSP